MSSGSKVVLAALLAASLAACGGGGGGGGSTPPVLGTGGVTAPTATPGGAATSAPTASAAPTSAPAAATTSTTIGVSVGSAPPAATLPAVASGYAAAVTLPTVTSGSGSIVAQLSTTSGALPVLQGRRRFQDVTANATALVYLNVTASGIVGFAGGAQFAFTLASNTVAGTGYCLAFYDAGNTAAGWQKAAYGPSAAQGAAVTFTNASPITLKPGTSSLALYVCAGPTPIPTIAPATPAPVASGSPAPAASAPGSTPGTGPSASPVPGASASAAPVTGATAAPTAAPSGTPATGAPATSAPATSAPTNAPVSTATSVPSVGYLATPPAASSSTKLTGATAATIVAMGLSDEIGNPALSTAQVTYGVSAATASTARLPYLMQRALAAGARTIGLPGLPNAGPAQDRRLHAAMHLAPAGARSTSGVRRTSAIPIAPSVNTTAAPWVQKVGAGGAYAQVPATMIYAGTNVYVWMDNSIMSGYSAAQLQQIGQNADAAIASDVRNFNDTTYTGNGPGGPISTCDSTGSFTGGSGPKYIAYANNKIHVFYVDQGQLGGGVSGYFSANNYYYQTALNCFNKTQVSYSNEVPMVYVGLYAGATQNNVLEQSIIDAAHESQHLISFVSHVMKSTDPNAVQEDAWINEGMSMLAQDLAVSAIYGGSYDPFNAPATAAAYLANPQNYMLSSFFGTEGFGGGGNYGLAYLFQRYLYDRFGAAYLKGMHGVPASYQALINATGVSNPLLLESDFALALAAASAGVQPTDPRWRMSYPLAGPRAVQPGQAALGGGANLGGLTLLSGLPANVYRNSFLFLNVNSPAGKTVTVGDPTGTFGLGVGAVQR